MFISYGYSGHQMIEQARQLVANGDLGKIRIVQMQFAHGGNSAPVEKKSGATAWRVDPKKSGSAYVLGDVGTHMVYLAEAVLSELKIKWLMCKRENFSHAPDVMNTFRLAELLGVKHIVSQSGLPAGSPTDTTLNWVLHTYPPEIQDVLKYQWEVTIEFWSKAAELAKSCGVETIALENHPMNMVFNVSTLLKLRHAVGDIIGLNLDPSHLFFMGGCFELGAYNGVAVNRVWNYVAVGYGHDHLWWKEFFGTLVMSDYHGSVSIEVEDRLMPNNLVAIQKSARFFKETMLS